jgi:polygalacturonase
MKKFAIRLMLASMLLGCAPMTSFAGEKFPDGTAISAWFADTSRPDIAKLGQSYRITDYGVSTDSTMVQTAAIQAVIERAAQNGGGVVVIPAGVYQTGALFFRQGTHLYLEEGAVLKGSDDISNFPVVDTRIEGQSLKYFAALVNADGLDGFTISGKGTINGNGERYWRSFWLRRAVNPKCTNMDELRPRLVYISNSRNVTLADVHFANSPFWTTHIYKCDSVRLLGLRITSPYAPVKAPSTDALDVDACENVHVSGCYMAVNDDAIALKGGKGPGSDKDPNNGGNKNILIEDCTFGFCHSVITFGSESIYDRNIVLRRCNIAERAERLLWLKMRPDTPQHYEYVLVEDVKGVADNFIFIRPWTQFFDLKGTTEIPMSYANNITMRNIDLQCKTFFNVSASDQYELKDFAFEKINVTASGNAAIDKSQIENFSLKSVVVNGEKVK